MLGPYLKHTYTSPSAANDNHLSWGRFYEDGIYTIDVSGLDMGVVASGNTIMFRDTPSNDDLCYTGSIYPQITNSHDGFLRTHYNGLYCRQFRFICHFQPYCAKLEGNKLYNRHGMYCKSANQCLWLQFNP